MANMTFKNPEKNPKNKVISVVSVAETILYSDKQRFGYFHEVSNFDQMQRIS